MLDFELESYKRRTTEDLEELKGTLENAVRDHRWRDLEYGTLDAVDVINWHACREELARRRSPVLPPRPQMSENARRPLAEGKVKTAVRLFVAGGAFLIVGVAMASNL
jgi:hypothetical protein